MDLSFLATPEVAVSGGIVIAVFVLVEVVKRTQVLPDRFLPALSIVIGLLIGLLFGGLTVIQSILVGAAASGLYDFGKKSVANQ